MKRISPGAGRPTGFPDLSGQTTSLPFSLGAEVRGLCFISGMPALSTEGTYVEGTFEEEVALAWKNVVDVAEAAGYGLDDIAFVQCLMADMGDWDSWNAFWREQFPDVSRAPARLTFQAGGLPFGAKVEIHAVAGRDR